MTAAEISSLTENRIDTGVGFWHNSVSDEIGGTMSQDPLDPGTLDLEEAIAKAPAEPVKRRGRKPKVGATPMTGAERQRAYIKRREQGLTRARVTRWIVDQPDRPEKGAAFADLLAVLDDTLRALRGVLRTSDGATDALRDHVERATDAIRAVETEFKNASLTKKTD